MPPTPGRRRYDSPARAAAARRRRTAIVQAFGDLLAAHGYQAATIKAVAERAGVSTATVYKTFDGKAGLVKALWDVTLAGDDEPVAMIDREQARAVLTADDPATKIQRYARCVRDVHERVTPLAVLLAGAGPEGTAVLAVGEQERRRSVRTFVDHLADRGELRPGTDPTRAADACWALTATALFATLTTEAGWGPAAYQRWLADMLTATLL